LIVERDEALRDLLCTVLGDLGWEVAAAATPTVAQGQLAQTTLRLIVIRSNDAELVGELSRCAPTIVLTDRPPSWSQPIAGVVGHLPLMFDLDELEAVVRGEAR
jgi:DNA-binding response OmpR family regulator